MSIKTISYLTIAFCVMTSFAWSQAPVGPEQIIEPYPLELTVYKTTNLVFPFPVISVDKGSKAILAQKAKGAENILQLKASAEYFEETNLTVVTTEGKLYSYLVNYSPYPEKLNLVFGKSTPGQGIIQPQGQNEAEIKALSSEVALKEKSVTKVKDEDYGMLLDLNGLYIKDDVFYYQVRIKNSTHVAYDISQLRFFIRDKKRSKRTATQEIEQVPLFTHGNTHRVEGMTETIVVLALPKQTIPDQKFMVLQLMEGHGGRHLQLKIKNKVLVAALPLEASP